MTGAGTSSATPAGQARRSPRRRGRKAARVSRVSVDRLLPDSVVVELQRSAATTTAITPELVVDLDERMGIAREYGVTRRRLGNYLRRLRADSNGSMPPGVEPVDRSVVPAESWNEKVRAVRQRQASVAKILDQTFGQLAKCNPDLWDRRAYLMLVGLVYERLATNEDELPTEELAALSKVLAENRRAESQSRKGERAEEAPKDKPPPSSGLPENFADVVRQVYGTNFQMPAGAGSDSKQ